MKSKSKTQPRQSRVAAMTGVFVAASVSLVLIILNADAATPSEGVIIALIWIQIGIGVTAMERLIRDSSDTKK